jgi:hypothetical protein
MGMLAARRWASTIGCGLVDYAAGQAQRDGTIVAQLPDPSLGISRPTGLLYLFPDRHFGKGDA